jgi:RimJ/RimL family protein N-acetyltransferase
MLLNSARILLIPNRQKKYDMPKEFRIANKSGETIGATSFAETENSLPEFQIIIFNETYRNHGIGTEVIKLMLEYGFEKLNYHEIGLYVFPFEDNAMGVYLKSGFRLRKIIEQDHYNREKYKTIFLMSVTKEEYKEMWTGK